MSFYVYMLKSVSSPKFKTYVGFTNNIKSRVSKHNTNKGAKATRGYKWIVIYSRRFKEKKEAMSFEYRLKKNRIKRASILKDYLDDQRN
jgi:putative endonuclease